MRLTVAVASRQRPGGESIGDHDGALAAIARMQALSPITMAWARENLTPFTDPDRWEAYLSALQSAGVPPG